MRLPDAVVTLVAVLGAVLMAIALVEVVHLVLSRGGRRAPFLADLVQHAHQPTRALAVLLAVRAAVEASTHSGDWRGPLKHVLWLGVIAASAWLVTALLLVAEDTAVARFRVDVRDNRTARRVHTQVAVLRRVTVAGVTVLAIGAMLMTFPAARTIGTSLLASAGIAGVVAGLAAQSLLGNMFAGMQLAFSDELRLDDVVVVEGEWGRVEEITLTYVVLHLWDDRRLTLPSSYFTTKPFQNWTRSESALLGTAELDVDWTVPVGALREELRRVLAGTELWDGRVSVLQVTDAVGGFVRLRALVSAADAGTLFDLRCHVRERLIEWLQRHHPEALPRTRAEVTGLPSPRVDELESAIRDLRTAQVPAGSTLPDQRSGSDHGDGATPTGGGPGAGASTGGDRGAEAGPDSRVFGGSADGRERGAGFAGPDGDRPAPR